MNGENLTTLAQDVTSFVVPCAFPLQRMTLNSKSFDLSSSRRKKNPVENCPLFPNFIGSCNAGRRLFSSSEKPSHIPLVFFEKFNGPKETGENLVREGGKEAVIHYPEKLSAKRKDRNKSGRNKKRVLVFTCVHCAVCSVLPTFF